MNSLWTTESKVMKQSLRKVIKVEHNYREAAHAWDQNIWEVRLYYVRLSYVATQIIIFILRAYNDFGRI